MRNFINHKFDSNGILLVFILAILVFLASFRLSYATLTLSSSTVSSDGALNSISTGNFNFTTTTSNADTLTLAPATGGGATFSGTITSADLTGSNKTWTLPNVSGTFITTGDTGSVTNAMLAGSITEAKHSFSDNTTGDSTTSQHGFLPKLGGGTSNFLRADGTWAAPSSGTSVGFLAYNSADDDSVNTGVNLDFNTEVYDTGSSFASDVFTAPQTGVYMLCTTVKLAEPGGNMTASATSKVQIVTSNNTFNIGLSDDQFSSGAPFVQSGCIFADMDANDTASVKHIEGPSLTIYGSGSPFVTFFSGRLIP